jgi:hypothetical protein
MKAIVNRVRVGVGGEITDFDIVNEEGLIGSFRLIEKDETRFGKYKLGQELPLHLDYAEYIVAIDPYMEGSSSLEDAIVFSRKPSKKK